MRFFERFKTTKLKLEAELIEREIHRSKRFGYTFSLLVLEVTNSIPRGLSKLLPGRTLSFHTLQKNLRPYDKIVNSLVRRYYIILPQTNKIASDKIKHRIYEMAEYYKWGDINIGIATYLDDGNDAKSLIKAATELLEDYSYRDFNDETTIQLARV